MIKILHQKYFLKNTLLLQCISFVFTKLMKKIKRNSLIFSSRNCRKFSPVLVLTVEATKIKLAKKNKKYCSEFCFGLSSRTKIKRLKSFNRRFCRSRRSIDLNSCVKPLREALVASESQVPLQPGPLPPLLAAFRFMKQNTALCFRVIFLNFKNISQYSDFERRRALSLI